MDPSHVITLNGRFYPLYAGILSEAHARGLVSLTTEIVQVPSAENDYTAITSSTAVFDDGSSFTDIADASPSNVNSRVAMALLRMSSTRSKGRALRDACNVGQTMAEELPDTEGGAPESGGDLRAAYQPHPASQRAVLAAERERLADRVRQPAASDGRPPTCAHCGKSLTKGQVEFSARAYGVVLCPAHQQAHRARQRR